MKISPNSVFKWPAGSLHVLVFANFVYMCAFAWYQVNRGVDADFKVIFSTTLRFISNSNVYFPLNEPLGTAYNSSLLYLLLSPLSVFSLLTASRIFLVINLILTIFIAWQATKFFNQKDIQTKISIFLVLLTVIQLSFSFRSTIANGQIALVVISLQLVYFNLMFKKDKTKRDFSPFLLWCLIELKPYLILPWLIYMILSRKYFKHLLSTFLIGCSLQFVYYFVNRTSTFIDYGALLFNRSGTTFQELDQSSLSSLLHVYFQVNKGLSLLIFAIVIVIPFVTLIKNLKLSEENKYVFTLLSAPLLSIYFHRQDSLLGSVFLGLFLYISFVEGRKKRNFGINCLVLLCLVLNMNWGSNQILPAIPLLGLMFLLLIFLKYSFLESTILIFVTFIMQFFQVLVFNEFGWQGSYKLWTGLVFIFQLVIVMIFLSPQFKKNSGLVWLKLT